MAPCVSSESIPFSEPRSNHHGPEHPDCERPRGGWDATNLATGKKILIKSAQRLRAAVRGGESKVADQPAEANAASQEVQLEADAQSPSPVAAVLKKPRAAKARAKTEGGEPSEKKLSCVAAALRVLEEAGQPMNTQEMIAAMEAKGYWSSPGGKTPHATLYSAILRDISKGDDSRFVKTERGRFTTRS